MRQKSSKSTPDTQVMTPEMRRFLGASMLLVIVLLGFFALMLPFSDHASVTQPEINVLDQLAEGKRQMLREAIRAEAAHMQQAVADAGQKKPKRSLKIGDGTTPTIPTSMSTDLSMVEDGADPEIQKAIQAIDAGNIADAVSLLEAVLKRDPKNEQALVELAMVYMLDLKQSGEAIGYLQRALDVNPDNKVVMSELVSLYEEEGRVDEGLAYMMERANAHPESSELSYGIGQMLSLQGREGEAIPYLERATQGSDNPVRAFRDLAEAYSRNGESDRAIDSYGRAIAQQEKEIQERAQQGMPTTFSEERLNNTKLDKARELIRSADPAALDAAQKLLDEVSASMPDLEPIASLQESLIRKRAG